MLRAGPGSGYSFGVDLGRDYAAIKRPPTEMR
jgi:hypothetical protein